MARGGCLPYLPHPHAPTSSPPTQHPTPPPSHPPPTHINLPNPLVPHQRCHDTRARRPRRRKHRAARGALEHHKQLLGVELLHGHARNLDVAQRRFEEAAFGVEHLRPRGLVLHEHSPGHARFVHPLRGALDEALRGHVVVRLQVRLRDAEERARALRVAKRERRRVDVRGCERAARAQVVLRAPIHLPQQLPEAVVSVLERRDARPQRLHRVQRHRLEQRVAVLGQRVQQRGQVAQRAARCGERRRVAHGSVHYAARRSRVARAHRRARSVTQCSLCGAHVRHRER